MIYLAQDQELKLGDKIQALYFYANWLVYHKKMLVMIEKMENQFPNIEFIAINTDDFPGIFRRYDVDVIPTVIVFNDAKEINRIKGLPLTSAFRKIFADIYNTGGNNDKEKK